MPGFIQICQFYNKTNKALVCRHLTSKINETYQPAEVIQFEDKIFHPNWSDFESSRSSAFRELLAVSLSLQAFIDSLEAQTGV